MSARARTGQNAVRAVASQIASSSRLPARSFASTSAATAPKSQSVEPPRRGETVASFIAQVDRPSSLAARFYPPGLQNHFLAIRAFNAEVSRVADSVENELMARIRIAWWRDSIIAAFNSQARKQPTMIDLAEAIHDPAVQQHGGLVLDHFVSLCDAREADLAAPTAPPTLEQVERYAERTSSRLFYLSLNLVGVSSPVCDEVFSHLGKARGIATLLSSVPFHAGVIRTTQKPEEVVDEAQNVAASKRRKQGQHVMPRQRRLVLPSEYLTKHGVVEEDVFRRGANAKGLRDAVFDTATRANDYIITARSLLQKEFAQRRVPTALVGPLVEATAATTFLHELQRRDFDIFDAQLQLVAGGRGWRLPWNMWKVGLRSGNNF